MNRIGKKRWFVFAVSLFSTLFLAIDVMASPVDDNARHLIYIANADGIWILSQQKVLHRHFCSSSDAISSAEPNCL
jgi:hypothetical protein